MRWSESDFEQVQKRIRDAGNKNRAAVSPDNVEQVACHEPVAKKKIQRLDSPCRIRVVSRRHKLADIEGISGKAMLDGLVHIGLLQDDTTEFVKDFNISEQEKISHKENEETEIIISWE